MDEIKEGDIVWAVPEGLPLDSDKLLVKIRKIYPSSEYGSTYLVERYPDRNRPWYTKRHRLNPLTPEEQLQLVTFGEILEVD
jgi:hypothetical protein